MHVKPNINCSSDCG